MNYLKITYLGLYLFLLSNSTSIAQKVADSLPNIILIMADDLGYGDVGYYGNSIVKTPNLDAFSKKGIRFDRFYSAGPVCSPTRASCLTGRHPSRMNISWAADGKIPMEEITVAEALKLKGYRTGHFGKWHVGQLSKTVKQGYYSGPPDPKYYSPPWENGFDECFTSEGNVPTFNPYYLTSGDFGSDDYVQIMDRPVEYGQREGGFVWRDRFWTGPGEIHDEWIEGSLPEILMDKALNFIQTSINEKRSFFAAIWFHTPHTPIVASPEHRALYNDMSYEEQHWFGSISAMDEQIGRLRHELKKLGIADNTILWFCSDNGPTWVHELNSTGPFKGKKGSLWEGGIRVPAILEWPKEFPSNRTIDMPIVTSDIYPTLLSIIGQKNPHNYPMDGIDITKILNGDTKQRLLPIGFQSPALATDRKDANAWSNISGRQLVWMDNQYKLVSFDDGNTWRLFDLLNDKEEQDNLIEKFPGIVDRMKKELYDWLESCRNSSLGRDY